MGLKTGVLLLLFVFCCASSAFACTSFALYGNQIMYGMNFDYFSVPLKFLIESHSGMNVFHLSFLFEHTIDRPKFKNYFAKTCGMNDRGLFCSCQEIEPYSDGFEELKDNEIHISDQYDKIATCSDVHQVRRFIEGKRSVQYIGPSVHNLFADAHGHAIVSETDNNENFITEMNDGFMVMSNFSNYSMVGKPYGDATGVGADRYKTAHDYILNNRDSFSVDNGFELLKRAVCQDPDCVTLCSMVFLPQTHKIYIALNQDYGNVWEVSLTGGTVQTHKGFTSHAQTPLGPEGILSTDLETLGC